MRFGCRLINCSQAARPRKEQAAALLVCITPLPAEARPATTRCKSPLRWRVDGAAVAEHGRTVQRPALVPAVQAELSRLGGDDGRRPARAADVACSLCRATMRRLRVFPYSQCVAHSAPKGNSSTAEHRRGAEVGARAEGPLMALCTRSAVLKVLDPVWCLGPRATGSSRGAPPNIRTFPCRACGPSCMRAVQRPCTAA